MKPSNIPSIELPRVKLSEVLLLLLQRINPGYMPEQKGDNEAFSAMDKTFWSIEDYCTLSRPEFNSKPYYIKGDWQTDPWIRPQECPTHIAEKKTFFSPRQMHQGYGIYTTSNDAKAMIAFLRVEAFELQINLRTREAICRHLDDGAQDTVWHPYTESIPLALNRFALEKAIDLL